MAVKVGELCGLLRLDDKPFHRGIGKAKNSFGRFTKSVAGFTAKIGGLLTTLATGAVSKMGIEFNAMMEQSELAWETLLGGAGEAEKMMNNLLKLGAKTPFEFEGLDKSAKLLSAMGFESDQLIPTLTTLGDAVSAVGGGQDMLEGVSRALGQIQTKGKLSTEEVMQLAEQGIPAWDLIAEKMGMSTKELMDMTSQGKIMADQAIPALLKGLNEDFGGAMQKQSKTFSGLMSTLKDNFSMLMGQVMEPVFNRMKEFLPTIIDLVNRISEAFTNGGWIGVMRELLPPEVAEFLIGAFATIKDTINTVKQTFIENKDAAIGSMNEMFTKLMPILTELQTFIKNVIDTIKAIWNEWGDEIIQIAKTAWNLIMGLVKNALGIINGILDVFIGLFTGDWRRMGEGLKKIWSNLWDAIKRILSGAWGILKSVFSGLWSKITGWFSDLGDDIIAKVKSIDLKQIGKDIIQGLIDGIKSMGKWIKNAIQDLSGWIPQWIKDKLGISSPSKVMIELGKFTGEGFEIGLSRSINSVAKRANEMARAAIPRMTPIAVTGATVNTMNSPIQSVSSLDGRPIVIQIPLNGRVIAQETYRDIDELLGLETRRRMRSRGIT